MGCLSYLCVFDHRRYLDEVVPAMRKLYETDEHEPWLAAVWPRSERRPVPRFNDGSRVMMKSTMAAPDLLDRPDAFPEGNNREEIVALFRRAVEATCLRECVYMGNAARARHFTTCYGDGRHDCDLDLSNHPYIAPLLDELDTRFGLWGDHDGGYNEGLNGYLDPDETWLLQDALDQLPLPLPRIEASLEAIDAVQVSVYSSGGDCPTKLAILRAFTGLALQGGHGLLWGGDLNLPPKVGGVVGSAATNPS